MLRYLSAIGLSEYISQKKFNEFLHRCTKDPRLHATSLETNNSDELLVEASVEMDTFALVLRGIKKGSSSVLPVRSPRCVLFAIK